MRKIITFSLVLFIGSLSYAGTHDPHVHGEAKMNMVIDQDILQIDLRLPAESVLGFEHRPTTKAEIKSLADVKSQLSDPMLFGFYTKRGFFKKESLLDANQSNLDIHFSFDEDLDHHHHDEHSEFKLTIEYMLPKNSEVAALSTKLFELFSDIHDIDLTIVFQDSSRTKEWESNQNKIKL
jgi:hypothetical protein